MITVENLRVSYGRIRALHGIGFHLDEGEVVTIIGANGAGKSTTLRAISRLIKVESGTRMVFRGRNLLDFRPEEVVSKLGISHVPEGRRLFGNLTVMENLSLAAFSRKDRGGIERDRVQVFRIFERLQERKLQKAGTLSGGEQQMLAIGRAFMSGRKVMLLDEPSMGLAPLLMLTVFDALREINREGATILLVEQNARLALQFAGRGYVLENGKLALEGSSEALQNSPQIKRAYLGG
jgi:branched-chain amino acid transport system ATP-binding protein